MKVKESTKRKRFLKLLKKFRELPEERFDIRSWVSTGKGPVQPPSDFLTRNDCGTTGCLAGWTVAWFPESWEYDGVGSPLLKSLGLGLHPVTRSMSEFFGGSENDWANIIYQEQYSDEEEYSEEAEVPKHLVMERLLELYSRLFG